ncbi:hypothetical protein DFQ26_003328 [Actinomortierella ambigua]|nr:hypothetical protein DFQ26_003328 [Actinomortierella ambigua]
MSAFATAPLVIPHGESTKSHSASHGVHPIAIQIPAQALAYLNSFNQTADEEDMQTPPLEPSSPCSSTASSPRFDSFMESIAIERRRRSREFFFPNMPTVESAAPVFTRASDLNVGKDSDQVSWAEHQRHRLRQFFFPSMQTVESASPMVTRAADLKLSVEQKQQKPRKQRRTREFFPCVDTFESAVPSFTRAADLKLADHDRISYGEHHRCRLQNRFFPSVKRLESAVPTVTRAADLKLAVSGDVSADGSSQRSTSSASFERPPSQASQHQRRASQEFFFPNQTLFESAVPVVTKASDLGLGQDDSQHWQKQAEIDQLYHAGSLATVDGRRMFRLL